MALNPTSKEKAAATIQVRKFKLSSAQLLAMHTTAVTNIIPAQSRYVAMPVFLYLMHPAGTAYANASRLKLQWGSTDIVSVDILTGFLDQATAKTLWTDGLTPSGATFVSQMVGNVNTALQAKLSAQIITGNFAVYGLVGYRLLPANLVSS